MHAVFVELPAFERYRAAYLDDLAFGDLQLALMKNPEAGKVIEGSGGLRKMRFADQRRSKVMADLTPKERKALRAMLKAELESRRAT